MREVPPGVSAGKTIEVTPDRTASAVGSGSLAVFATPCMVALMEEAACLAVAPFLEGDETTVGTVIDVKHTAPTPVGGRVTVRAALVNVDGRRLTFQVMAQDEIEPVGAGTITRIVVNSSRFLKKASLK